MPPDPAPRRKLELLCPAGDWASLKAAVANGADAVYFGLPAFNARARAANFSLEELPEVIGYLHGHNVRGYVALNTIIFSDELPAAADYVRAVASAGADGVIVQDLGLARLIGRLAPTLPIHCSTQMTLTEYRGIRLLQSLGVTRVILARELSIEQIAEIRASEQPTTEAQRSRRDKVNKPNSPCSLCLCGGSCRPDVEESVECQVELEVFCHGAICLSFSGQCLASRSLMGRSGNRGRCAQPCRLPWRLVVDGKDFDAAPRYPLSPQDLAAHDLVARLAEAGAAGLKIEGRLKDAHYVAAAARVYRAAIDSAGGFALSPRQELMLAMGFSRGFTHGFLAGADHRRLVAGQSPKGRGLRLGKVVGASRSGIVVEVERPEVADLRPGDGVVFEVAEGEEEPGGRVYSVRTGAVVAWATTRGGTWLQTTQPRHPVELTFGNDVDLSAVRAGAVAWKTDDPRITKELESGLGRDVVVRPAPVAAMVRASAGERLAVTLRDERGNEATVASDHPLQPAKKHPLTAELVRGQLSRLGGTPFALESVVLLGPDGPADELPVMAPKSVLNDLRRRAAAELLAVREARCRHAIAEPDGRATAADNAAAARLPELSGGHVRLSVLVRTLAQLKAVLELAKDAGRRPLAAYCDFQDYGDLPPALADCRKAGILAGVATPRIILPGEEPLLEELAGCRPEAVLVRNLGSLDFFRGDGRDAPTLVGDASLNVANELSAALLAEWGLTRITPAFDLDLPQLNEMLGHVSPALFEPVLHGHVPMFHTAHCLWAANIAGKKDCADCREGIRGHSSLREPARLGGQREKRNVPICRVRSLALRDRNGVVHPVLADAAGRNTIFDGRPYSAERFADELVAGGVRRFRVELLDESADQTSSLLAFLVHPACPSGRVLA